MVPINPQNKCTFTLATKGRVVELNNEGKSYDEIVRIVGYTTNQIANIIKIKNKVNLWQTF